MELQPSLRNGLVDLRPLAVLDFDALYAVASDPLIWEQHPSSDRYLRDRFQVYFDGGIESKGALLALDSKSGRVIGCSRFYDHDPEAKSIIIGYSFLAKDCWGKGYNLAMKTLMLDHAFRWVEDALFHVGTGNLRSQKAMERLGAEKIGVESANVIYRIRARDWKTRTERHDKT